MLSGCRQHATLPPTNKKHASRQDQEQIHQLRQASRRTGRWQASRRRAGALPLALPPCAPPSAATRTGPEGIMSGASRLWWASRPNPYMTASCRGRHEQTARHRLDSTGMLSRGTHSRSSGLMPACCRNCAAARARRSASSLALPVSSLPSRFSCSRRSAFSRFLQADYGDRPPLGTRQQLVHAPPWAAQPLASDACITWPAGTVGSAAAGAVCERLATLLRCLQSRSAGRLGRPLTAR